MKIRYDVYVVITIIIIYGISFGFVYGDNNIMVVNKLRTLEISNLNNVEELPIQYYHISQIMANKYPLIIDNKNYTVFYELSNLNTSGYDYDGKVSNIFVVSNKNLMLIHLDNILQTDEMTIRFNTEIISAENEKFSLLVDGIEKQYALNTFKQDVVMSFIITKGSHQIEIEGTKVVPEFGLLFSVIFVMSIMSVIIISRKFQFHH
ncbi:Uncharacterised protein [uncultured archaeon]|nr:Uncharacterised protein [uncultured archaeon]